MTTRRVLWLLMGLVLGFVLSSVPGQAQSYRQEADGSISWRYPNPYDTGGITYGSQGPVYDYGVPYMPPPRRPQREPDVDGGSLAADLSSPARLRMNCQKIVELEKFLESMGQRPTRPEGVCGE